MDKITKDQWYKVCTKFLGLRSEDNQKDIKRPASYAMNCGEIYIPGQEAPKNWIDLLEGTIKTMQEFGNYKSRFLLIVSQSSGSDQPFEYKDCFPKCSTKPTEIHASISLDNELEHLMKWVIGELQNLN